MAQQARQQADAYTMPLSAVFTDSWGETFGGNEHVGRRRSLQPPMGRSEFPQHHVAGPFNSPGGNPTTGAYHPWQRVQPAIANPMMDTYEEWEWASASGNPVMGPFTHQRQARPSGRSVDEILANAMAHKLRNATLSVQEGKHKIRQVGNSFEDGPGTYEFATRVTTVTGAYLKADLDIDQLGHSFTKKQ